MTYTRVAHDAVPGAMTERPHDETVDAFLIEHVEALRALARRGDAPAAHFVDDESRAAFERLQHGTPEAFLEAAGTLSTRLIGQMDKRSAPGLLVCLRVEGAEGVSGAALKLEVVTEHAAVLEALETGEEVLAGATNVLDAPGQLQKGALVNDPRADSEVVVGDRLAKDALYFPTALGIRTQQRATDAAVDLINAVAGQLPGSAREVVRQLPELEPGTTEEVLAAVAARIPAVTPELATQISDVLAAAKRPVRTIDTHAVIKEIVEADGITVSGASPAMGRALSVEHDPDGGWRIIIRVSTEPRISYRR